jgi:hypothetical protein
VTPSGKIGTSSTALTCAQCEEYVADFLDGTLGAVQTERFKAHVTACASCAEFAHDAGGAMALTGRAAAVEVPSTLIPQILAEITTGSSRVLVQASLAERIFGPWIRPLLQPRFALGLAMAALSMAVIPWRWPTAAATGLAEASTVPAKILTIAENRVYRVYDRAVMSYEDSALVANAGTQIDEWRAASEQDANPAATGEGRPLEAQPLGVQPLGAQQR